MTPPASPARFEIYRDYQIDAARRLLGLPAEHKCGRVHGHAFRVRIWVAGSINQQGWVVDFADIDRAMAPVLEALDHRFLNEVQGLEQPTTERLALWIADELRAPKPPAPALPGLCRVEVHETGQAGVVLHVGG